MNEFLAGAAVTFVISLIVLGRLVTVWYDTHIEDQTRIFALEEQVTHLKQQKSPVYQIPVGSVNPVAQRNPPTPESPVLEAGDWGLDGGVTHRIGEADVWDGNGYVTERNKQ